MQTKTPLFTVLAIIGCASFAFGGANNGVVLSNRVVNGVSLSSNVTGLVVTSSAHVSADFDFEYDDDNSCPGCNNQLIHLWVNGVGRADSRAEKITCPFGYSPKCQVAVQ